MRLRKKIVGIQLGVKDGGSFLLDENRFINQEDFIAVNNFLTEIACEMVGVEKNTIINKIKQKNKHNPVIFTNIAFLLSVIFFFIGTQGSVEYSDNINFLTLGANTKETINEFEIYRIASSTFLHISIFHLLLNLLVLAIFSQYLEKVLSYVRFSNLFLLSSAVAVLMSAWLSKFDASIGASGGIFGLWGAYTVLKLKYEDYLPGSVNAIPTRKFYFILVAEIFLEVFVIENVDYINHLGGFITGFAYLYFIPLGAKLETIDQPTMIEKTLFIFLVSFYIIGLLYFLMLYYAVIPA